VAEAEAPPKRVRMPPGTWITWESPFFYITKVTGWSDVKIWIKWPLRKDPAEGGLGKSSMSKTLTPRDYGGSWEDPWRSFMLLRAWAIWRADWHGWAAAHQFRQREMAHQRHRL